MRNTRLASTLFFVLLIGSSFSSVKSDNLEKMMKQMLSYLKKEKKQIETNQPTIEFPVAKDKFSKAKVPAKKLSNGHQEFINTFFEDLNTYQKAKDSVERRATFNVMVNGCISCHEHECPGPIVVIKKSLF